MKAFSCLCALVMFGQAVHLIVLCNDRSIGIFGLRKDRESRPHLVNMLANCHQAR